MRLLNLIELMNSKEQKRETYERIKDEHEWEIAYQEYYHFLTTTFYHFLKGLHKQYKEENLPQSKILYEFKWDIPNNNAYVIELISKSGLGTFVRYYENTKKGEIDFLNKSLEDITYRFYEELQRVERTMKSPEEMNLELQEFIKNNPEYIKSKKEKQYIDTLESIIEDETCHSRYYEFLETLYKKSCNFLKEQDKNNNTSSDIIWWHCSYESKIEKECISRFLSFYHFGYDDVTTNGQIFFIAEPERMKTAYFQEMQRLDYFIGPKKTLKQ